MLCIFTFNDLNCFPLMGLQCFPWSKPIFLCKLYLISFENYCFRKSMLYLLKTIYTCNNWLKIKKYITVYVVQYLYTNVYGIYLRMYTNVYKIYKRTAHCNIGQPIFSNNTLYPSLQKSLLEAWTQILAIRINSD